MRDVILERYHDLGIGTVDLDSIEVLFDITSEVLWQVKFQYAQQAFVLIDTELRESLLSHFLLEVDDVRRFLSLLLLRLLGCSGGSSGWGIAAQACAGRGGGGASLRYGAKSSPKRSSSLMYALGRPLFDLLNDDDAYAQIEFCDGLVDADG